ncbi:spinster family MFS transporter [Parasphingorhabdus halotolerans]|uniref:MFS transporter n=1 Tax=Parasphingorhabdus halotolerans TaxID=2725558 RepID=A0A6H2DHV5_9SPHN|nr:MFS transporter [Parasphingorhabdus halotolerans]QJB68252.1 MFS transporter [Parasphingorhabdus halotolerans]
MNSIETEKPPRAMPLIGNRWYTLMLLALVYLMSSLDRFLLGIVLPYIKAEMVLSDTLLGLLSGAAFAIFYATLGLPIARLADRYSRKLIITVSLAIFSVMTVLCGFASSFAMLFAARIGVGIGEAGTGPASFSIISDRFEQERRSTAMGILSLGGNFGLLLGFVAGGYIAAHWGWRSAFLLAGLPGMLLALLIHFTMKEPRRGAVDGQAAAKPVQQASIPQAIRILMAVPSYRHLVSGMALLLFGATGMLAWIPSLVDRSFGLSPDKSGLPIALIIISAGITGTLLIGGMLADRLSKRDPRWLPGIAAIGALVMSAGAIGVALAPTIGWLWVVFSLVAVGSTTYVAPSLALSQSLSPVELRATSGALALMIANLFGLGLGAPVIGMLSDFLEPELGKGSLAASMLLIPILGVWAAFHFARCAAFLPHSGPSPKETLTA